MSDTNTGPFTDAERTDIRRFCWYPAYGPSPDSFQNWRFFQWYGTLEYRLTNMSVTELAVVRTNYLTNLYTDKAAVWTHNKTEVPERIRLFAFWRKELCRFLGVPPGPGLQSASGRTCVV
jgi:hypothetical protein